MGLTYTELGAAYGSLPGWMEIRNGIDMAISPAQGQRVTDWGQEVAIGFRLDLTSLPFPCHDDHPIHSLWGYRR